MKHLVDLMSEQIVKSLVETIPMEITVIDENDEVVGWNKDESRIFKRAWTSIGLNFRQCHPAESLPLVEKIVNEMKEGKRQKARFWIDLPMNDGNKHKILIEFFALHDHRGKYIGCMECAQDVEEIMHLQGEKRLLDN